MYTMKKLFSYGIVAMVLLLVANNSALAVSAAILKFDPTASSTTVGGTVTPKVNVSSGDVQIAGTDIYILYDPAFLEPQSVTAGTHFPIVTNNITSGKVYISAVVDNSSQYKTGEGTAANVTFKALKEGTTTLTYYCDLTKNDTSKIVKNDINATNVIECAGNGTHTVTIGNGTTSGVNPTAIPGTTTSGGTTYTSTQNVNQLPQSGVYENVVMFAVPGLILFALGAAARLYLRI